MYEFLAFINAKEKVDNPHFQQTDNSHSDQINFIEENSHNIYMKKMNAMKTFKTYLLTCTSGLMNIPLLLKIKIFEELTSQVT